MVTDAIRARLWAFKTESVIIYPLVIWDAPTYSYAIGNRKVVLQKANIVIKVGNGETIGKSFYKQNSELENKINELYIYYYDRANPQ
jgi:inosine-uridine nucleoside N-ribohydrolase